NNTLNFDLIIDEEINLKSFKIPTHILIPFIENSIWKGLFRQPGEKDLSININKDKDKVIIEIRDNGNYRNSQPGDRIVNNLVKGMKIVDEKIKIYNKSHDANITYYTTLNEKGGLQILQIPL